MTRAVDKYYFPEDPETLKQPGIKTEFESIDYDCDFTPKCTGVRKFNTPDGSSCEVHEDSEGVLQYACSKVA